MKRKPAYLIYIAILLLMISVAVVPGRAAKDDRASALASQVLIRRDTYGVPHILADTEEAAAFGMGYAQAEDHPIEIARRLLSARGEEAKYTGAGVENDFFVKRYGVYETGKKNFDKLSPLFQKILHAYAAGFNRYVERHRKELPDWIPAFDGYDVLAISFYTSSSLII